MDKAELAVIGGTGFKNLLKDPKQLHIKTPYGPPPSLSIGTIDNTQVAFLLRHGTPHSIPPHKINYKANIYALHKIGVDRIIAVNAVGAINCNFKSGDVVIPHDFIDFTKLRPTTYYDEAPVTHVDVSQPYCHKLRKLLTQNARKAGLQVWNEAVLVCTEGPRFETPAEIEMFRRLGCDIVGMTGIPEAVLARELEICYAAFCFVSNMAAGIQKELMPIEVSKISEKITPKIEQTLIETLKALPQKRDDNCPCATALRDSRVK